MKTQSILPSVLVCTPTRPPGAALLALLRSITSLPSDLGARARRCGLPVGTAGRLLVFSLAVTGVFTSQRAWSQDINPPVAVYASGSATFDKVTVGFNEVVNEASANDSFNYTITDGVGNALNVSAAMRNPDGTSVMLTTDPQTEDTLYTITMQNISDAAGNVIGPSANTVLFRSWVATSCGGLLFESYNTGSGTAVSNLTSHPDFPNTPRERLIMTTFDTRTVYPDDSHDSYGARIRGLFIPPISGNWIFYLRSDDASQLFLNPTGPNAAGKVLVTEETGCCSGFAAHASAPVALTAGQGYYIEALYKEGAVGDYCQVAAKLSTDPTDPNTLTPIPGAWLGYPAAPTGIGGPVNILQQPADLTVEANHTATFSVMASSPNSLPLCYQWRRDGIDVPGAIGPSYSLLPSLADNGATFQVRIGVVGSSTVSRTALLRVSTDTNAPACVSASASLTLSNVVVRFSELMDGGTMGDSFNYSIPGFNVNSANANADGMSVTLTLDAPLNPGTSYQVTIQSLTDLAGNVISPNPCTLNFRAPVVSCGFLVFQAYRPESTSDNNLDTTLLSDRNFPSNPNEVAYMSAFDTRTVYPDDSHDGYGALIFGYFIPPVSGNWIFYLRSDGSSRLYLNPNDTDPRGKTLIQEETGCCGAFSAHASAPQALTAGQQVYIEALYKESTGPDYCQVAAKLDTDPTNPDSLRPISGAYLAALADPTGATLNITHQPTDQVFLQDGGQGAQPVVFTVAINASRQPVFYQWYRDNGSGFVAISGANSPSYSILPVCSDNGARFRVQIYIPGAVAISATATLTVLCTVTLNCPTNIVAECTGGLTPVTFTVTAVDYANNPIPVTCVPPSGTGFRLGTSNVVCTATDNLGSSSSCAFTVTVVDTTPPRVTCPSNITAQATGASGAVVTYIAAASDACGIASFDCSPPSGGTFSIGMTTVTCTATDGTGNSNSCSFTVTVDGNQCPTALAKVSPNAQLLPGQTDTIVIAANNSNACVTLDGTMSSDPDGDTLTYAWTVDGFKVSMDPGQEPGGGGTGTGSGTVTLSGNTLTIDITFSGLSAAATAAHIHGPAGPGTNAAVLYPLNAITTLGGTIGTIHGAVTLTEGTGGFTVGQQIQQLCAGLWYINIHTTLHPGGEIRGQVEPGVLSGAIVSTCLDVGSHDVTLCVNDGKCAVAQTIVVDVLTPCQAEGVLILLIQNSTLPRNTQRPLIASIKAACASFEDGRLGTGINQLQAFQNKVATQVAPLDPALAQQLTETAQAIIDALSGP